MKRLAILGALTVAALGLGMTAMPSASAQQVTSISFVGYCDGMQVAVPGSAGAPGAQGMRIGAAGCLNAQDHVYGAATPNGTILVEEPDADVSSPLVWVISASHNFMIYDDCGNGTECLLNSGTWTYGAPTAPAHGNLPSVTAGARSGFRSLAQGFAGARKLPGPNSSTININYISYCDGEQINLPGAAGAPGADGVETGCSSNVLLGAGNNSMVAMWDYTVNDMWVNMRNRTWILFTDCGDGSECYVNSGTWGVGPPAQPTKKRTVMPSNGH